MQVLPVLDVMSGQVVRGIGGRRDQYRPIVSRLTRSTDPVQVARALRGRFGLSELYLADLDAITGKPPALEIYAALHKEDFHLWVDAGIHEMDDARILAKAGVASIIAGLETLARPEALNALCQEHGSERVVFSLDLKAGRSLGNAAAWPSNDPGAIAELAIAAGLQRLLVLDLAHVGSGAGTGTEALCGQLARAYPRVRLAAGGGVGGIDDVRRLAASGVKTVLIASALHDGRICGIEELVPAG